MNDLGKRYWRLGVVTVLAICAIALIAPRLIASISDTIADRELGQGDFVHSTSPSFVRSKSLSLHGDPRANMIAIDAAGGHIYVADRNNNRVLGWSNVGSFVNGQDADIVIAAPDFLTAPFGCGDFPNGLCGPFGLAVDPSTGNLWIADDHSLDEVDAPFTQTGPAIPLNNGKSHNTFGCCPFDDFGVASDAAGDIYVANRNNSDVVEYDAGSTTPHLVFGQSTAAGGGCNKGLVAPTADTICVPYGVAVDHATGDVYISDTGNNRVLVFFNPLAPGGGTPGTPGSSGDTTADLVIGQADFTHAGAATTATALFSPRGLVIDSHHNLFVADTFNHRVTEYDAPLADGESETLVIGQPNATSNACNFGKSPGSANLCNPAGVAVDGSDNLYVVDANNERVLAFVELVPPRNGVASRVLGQHDLLHATTNFVDATTVNPVGVAIDRNSTPNHLYVADDVNSRVLGYNDAATFANGGAADIVIGQPDFFSDVCIQTVTASTLCGTVSGEYINVAVDPSGNLWVGDPGNRRALEFNAPFSSGMNSNEAASIVLGEPDFTTVAGGLLCPNDATHICPSGLAFDSSGNLYAADSENNRVFEYNSPLTYKGTTPQPADLVFGQGTAGNAFTSGGCNLGTMTISEVSMCHPIGVALDSHDNLYVADAANNRVLLYYKPLPFVMPEPIGNAGDVTADQVFGQAANFSNNMCNRGGAASSTTLCDPVGIAIDKFSSIFIDDEGNNRILGFAEFTNPPANFTAGLEFGHGTLGTDFTSTTGNTGGLSANSLSTSLSGTPSGIDVDSSADLYVADQGNARLVAYDGPFAALDEPTPTATATASPTPTASATATATRTATVTATTTATATATNVATATATATATPTATRTATATATATATSAATATATATATQTATPTSTATPTGSGKIKVKPTKLEFGDLQSGAMNTKHFKIGNTQSNTTLIGTVGQPMGTGAAQFMIVSGATSFSLPKGGQGDVISVKYTPSAPGATDTATITITSSDPNHPTVTVRLIGKGKKSRK